MSDTDLTPEDTAEEAVVEDTKAEAVVEDTKEEVAPEEDEWEVEADIEWVWSPEAPAPETGTKEGRGEMYPAPLQETGTAVGRGSMGEPGPVVGSRDSDE